MPQDLGKTKVFDRHLISVASVTVMGAIMSILDTTIVNVALDTLVRSFHTSLANIQWVSTGYLLSLAMVIPMTRWVIDRFGTKKAWMTSVLLFVVGSLLCGMAWSSTSLIVFRVMQGLGGGMIMPIGQTILARESGPDRLARVMTVVGVPQLLGPMLGPVLGGFILSSVSWRWIFYVNVPIGIIALVRAQRILSSTDTELSNARRLDVPGMLLLSPGLALAIYGLAEFGNKGRLTTTVMLAVGIGVVLIGGFMLHALRRDQPLLNLRLWRNRGFAMANLTTFLFSGAMNAGTFLAPLYYQMARGASPLKSAVLMASGGLGGMIGMPNAGKVSDRYGPRRIVPFALIVLSLSFVPFTQVSATTSLVMLSVFWGVRGIGAGATNTPTMAAGYMTLDKQEIASATTLNNIGQRIGASLGVASAAVILQRRLASVVPHGTKSLAHLSALQRLHDAPALSHAFGFVFWIIVGTGMLALIPALQLPTKRRALAESTEVAPSVPDARGEVGALATD